MADSTSSTFSSSVNSFIDSLNKDLPSDIFYQSFDFSLVPDSRVLLTNFNYDKTTTTFLDLQMISDLFQLFAAVHSAIAQKHRDFSVDVPSRLCNTKSMTDALRLFGGYGKPYIIVVSIADKEKSEQLFKLISAIPNVKTMDVSQMQQHMNNQEKIQEHYFGSTRDSERADWGDPVREIVTKMACKNL